MSRLSLRKQNQAKFEPLSVAPRDHRLLGEERRLGARVRPGEPLVDDADDPRVEDGRHDALQGQQYDGVRALRVDAAGAVAWQPRRKKHLLDKSLR